MKHVFAILFMAGIIGSAGLIQQKLLRAVPKSEWFLYLWNTEPYATAGVFVVCGFVIYTAVAVGMMVLFMRIPFFRQTLEWKASEQPAPVMENGRKRLSLAPSVRALGWLGVLVALACACALEFSCNDPGPAYSIWGRRGGCLLLGMLGTFGILMHRKWALEYDAYELKYVPVFHRAITFAWEDVESVRLLKRGEGWELRLAGGPKVTVSREMMGAREFLLTLTEKTGVRVAGDG